MTSGAWLLLTFFCSLFHGELVVAGIDNFRAVTLGQEQNSTPPIQDPKSRVSLGLLHSRLRPK